MNNKIKYLISVILLVFTIFSSIGLTNASRGEIDKVLNLKFGVEQIEYKLQKMPNKKFKNKSIQIKYNQFKVLNNTLIKVFYKKYKSGKIDYYTTKGIIINHEKFIYQSGMLFTYLEIKSTQPKYRDINEKIINSYSQMRISYNRINFLFERSKK